jgi:glycerol-3-phosphate acyltransferase PlsY
MMAVFCGLAALGGHLFPIWLDFKGGKGAATGIGITFGMGWIAASVAMGLFLVVFAVSRMVSLGSVIATISVPITFFFTGGAFRVQREQVWIVTGFFAVAAIAIVIKHKENLKRIARGEEPRWGAKAPPAEPKPMEVPRG